MRSGLLVLILVLTCAVRLDAQQRAEATHMIVRYFQCPQQRQAVERMQEGGPIVRQMIQEGKFLDYQLLTHNWGDEWNVVDYFLVNDLPTFFTNFAELGRRGAAADTARAIAAGRDPQTIPSISQFCNAHKDNIYTVARPPEQE